MYGAMIGDIVGSRFEFLGMKNKNFQPLFTADSKYTDDSVMTVAVAYALLTSDKTGEPFKSALVREMKRLGREYPRAGYGGMFSWWLECDSGQPYNSYGNGSAMRVSPCGLYAATLEEALQLAKQSAEVTHNHPEGIRGAEAVAGAVFLAKTGADKAAIRQFVSRYYDLHRTVDQIRPNYVFEVSCQKSVPEAITCFLESESYEDAIRLAISLGGDTDTQACIAGSIAWSFFEVHPTEHDRKYNAAILAEVKKRLPLTFQELAAMLKQASANHLQNHAGGTAQEDKP